ncbi:MAG TPA: glycogen debranching N-terminal domain-containing protein, partial [Terriglobales bacterium]|nr:glycogen debranching N-terminal domain-containing protein [Terriglobales bacterium]
AQPKLLLPGYSGKVHGTAHARGAIEESIELRLGTVLSDGFHQDADLTNYTIQAQSVAVELEIAADFCGLDEALDQEMGGRRQQQGKLIRHLDIAARATHLGWHYHAHHRHRGLTRQLDRSVNLKFTGLPPQTRWSRRGCRFQLTLAPGATAHLCIELSARVEERELHPAPGCYGLEAVDARNARFLEATARLAPPPQPQTTLERAVERARHDLAALRMFDLDRPDNGAAAWVPAAGIPNYVATFGRDILTAAWQSAMLAPDIMRGSLHLLRELQGRRDDAWRDEEPGKMLHEAHTGPLAVLDYKPQCRYYGSFNTSPFYIIVLSEFYHWTGDQATTLAHLDAARDALAWMDRYGHPGHKHFYAFRTRSSQGVKNQGWKDSGDAIIYPDGRLVPDPIAGCPIQGYAYEAKLRMAELLWLAGERAAAARVLWQAHELKKRFNDIFWMDDERYFAMALDARGKQVRSIGSDPGDALATGIIDQDRVAPVVERLFSPELFSGWGIRTLSSQHLAYNPYSYHRGSVWPAENAAIGVGLRRYGYCDRLAQLLRAQMEVAERFQFVRLPEVMCGHGQSAQQPFPPVYPKACSPQAWSAGAPVIFLQMLLGIYPYAPFQTLFLDPQLPEWLPRIRLERLRVGPAEADIEFRRAADGSTKFEVTRLDGHLRVVQQPSPWSAFATPKERIEDLLDSFTAA